MTHGETGASDDAQTRADHIAWVDNKTTSVSERGRLPATATEEPTKQFLRIHRMPVHAWCREAVDAMNRTTRLLVSAIS